MKTIYLIEIYTPDDFSGHITGAYEKESMANDYVDRFNLIIDCKRRFSEYLLFKAEVLEREGKDNQFFLENYDPVIIDLPEIARVVKTLYHESVDQFIAPESKL